jgi:hypothetical protein
MPSRWGIDPVPDSTTMTPRLGRSLRRLSTALIAYGLIGLLAAALGLVALSWLGGRLAAAADRTSAQVDAIITTLDTTSDVLADASDAAVSFGVTLERTPPVVRQAADTIGNLQANLRSVEQQLDSIAILGSRPLGGVAGVFGQMATDISGLDTRLGLIADSLEEDKAALLANAESLAALGAQLGNLADGLRGGIVEESFADVQAVLTVMLLLLVAWTAVPAVGALGVGIWLRRDLAPSLAA